MKKDIIIPQVNNLFETIDTTVFVAQNRRHSEVVGNEYINYTRGNIGYGKETYTDNSSFKVVKSFFPNGKIRKKGVMFNNGSKYGIWYNFDKEGNVTSEETDEGYDFQWEEVIKYCNRNDIVLEQGVPTEGGVKTEIYQMEEAGQKVWIISYYQLKIDKYLEVTLDGKKGSELKRRELEFVGN